MTTALRLPPMPPPRVRLPAFAGGGRTPDDMVKLVYQRALEYAQSHGASSADAQKFATANLGVVNSESEFNAGVVNRAGAVGLYQNLRGAGRGGNYSVQQLQDPEFNIRISLPEMWSVWQQHGLATADPVTAAAGLSRWGQRPGEDAVQGAIKDGRFATGVAKAGQLANFQANPNQAGVQQQTATPVWSGPRNQQLGWSLPAQGEITSRFGTPFPMDAGRSYQGQQYAHFNSGIDIGAAMGSPVSSMSPGTVVQAGDDGAGWGTRVVIRDPDGLMHSYGHLSSAAVKVGQQVQAGQQIAASGNSGKSSGPHLSYDVFDKDGVTPVDPTPWLTRGGQGQSAVDPAIKSDPAQSPRPSYLGGGAATGPHPPGQTNGSIARAGDGGGG